MTDDDSKSHPTGRQVASTTTPQPESAMLELAGIAYRDARDRLMRDGVAESRIHFHLPGGSTVVMPPPALVPPPPPHLRDDVEREAFVRAACAAIQQLHPDYYVAVHEVWTVVPDPVEEAIDKLGGAATRPRNHPRRQEAVFVMVCAPGLQWGGFAPIARDAEGKPSVAEAPPQFEYSPSCRGRMGNFYQLVAETNCPAQENGRRR